MIYYLALALLTVLLRNRLPKRAYTAVITAAQLLLCGLRHPHLTGDLMKYHWLFLNGGEWAKNFGFDLWMQGISWLTEGNFQIFLFLTGAITQIAAGYTIGSFCPEPWLGFLTWQCLGFYVTGFSAVKQALAMAFVLLAYGSIEKGNLRRFLVLTGIAGMIHHPAMIFLPAYGLTRLRFDRWAALAYGLLGGLVWCFRDAVTGFVQSIYYGQTLYENGGASPGGRFFLMILMLLAGVILRGFGDDRFDRLCHLMAMAAVVQMLAVYGNAFSRLADYYFQFAILYLPMLTCPPGRATLPLDRDSRKLLSLALAGCLLLFYWAAYLDQPIVYETDNYLHYQFFWQSR